MTPEAPPRREAPSRDGRTDVMAADVEPAPLDPGWPVVPPRPGPKTLSADERNALPFEATACPSCGVAVAKPPKGRKRCSGCGEYMFVRVVGERRRLVTGAQAADLDAADEEHSWEEGGRAEREWRHELVAVGLNVSDEDDLTDLDVVGESFHHADLASLMAALRPEPSASDVHAAALLVREPQNPHDRNAVQVVIHGKVVGHMNREDAADIQPWLKKVGRRGQPVYVLARLGGGKVADGRVGPVGVTLEGVPEDALS